MCDVTGGLASAAVYSAIGWTMAGTAAAGGYAAWGQTQAGKAQKAQNDYSANLAEQEATLTRRAADENIAATKRAAEQNITLTQTEASQRSKSLADKSAELAGTQKAAAAAQGIGGGSVTTADIAADTVTKEQLDQDILRYNADMSAWAIGEESKNTIRGINDEASNAEWSLKNKAKQYRQAGKNAVDASKIAATSTLLNTATTVAGAASYSRGYGSYTPEKKTPKYIT